MYICIYILESQKGVIKKLSLSSAIINFTGDTFLISDKLLHIYNNVTIDILHAVLYLHFNSYIHLTTPVYHEIPNHFTFKK